MKDDTKGIMIQGRKYVKNKQINELDKEK